VVCDLNVDPYVPTGTPPTVRSIEGIPLGTLDQWLFTPDDPKWTETIPEGVAHAARRTVVSCYSWPGIHPRDCMEHYGRQLEPLLVRLLERGGGAALTKDGDALDRALWRAGLGPLAD
jgi:alanine dehydrogenase